MIGSRNLVMDRPDGEVTGLAKRPRASAMRLLPPDPAAEARRILRLAWPVMLTSLNWTLLHLIDVAIVGHAGTDQLGALAAARALTFITIVMALAGLSGVLVFASRADGAGDRARPAEILRSGVLLGVAGGIVLMIVLRGFAEPLILGVGVAPALAPGGAAVARALALAYPAQLTLSATAYYLEGISRPRRVTVVNLAMLPLNALLAWAWTDGRLGLPAWGAVGAASATALVSWLGAAAMLASAWTLPGARERGVRDLSRAALRRAAAGVPALVAFGAVPAIAAALELAGFSWLIALSTRLGAVSAAAFQAVFSLQNFAFTVALGLASAAGVRTGNAVGAGDRDAAPPRTTVAGLLAVALLGGIALIYYLAAHWIIAPFSDDPAVRALAAWELAVLAPFIVFDGLQAVAVYALRSLGDQIAAGINGIVAYFLVTGGLGWLLVRDGYGNAGLIAAATAGMTTAAVLQIARLAWISAPARSRTRGSARARQPARRPRRS